MKKICFITTVPTTLTCFVLETAKYLHEQGDYEITCICDRDDSFAAQIPSYIRYIPVPMSRGIHLGGLSAIRAFKKIFRENQFDIVQYSTPNAALYASIAAKATHVPVRLYGQWGIRYVGFDGPARLIFKELEKLVCRNSTIIRSASPLNMAYAVSEGLYTSEKAKVLGRGGTVGVDLRDYPSEKKAEMRADVRRSLNLHTAYVFGFVGRLSRDKGGNELLEAFRSLSERRDDVILLLVGPDEADGGIDSRLLEWAKQSDRVVFTGNKPHGEMPAYYAAMDVLVHPTYREGFGLVLQEAAAMELAVLTTRIPGASEVLEEGTSCLLCEPRDTESLLGAMERLCDRTYAESLGKAARLFTEQNYERASMVARQYADYEQIWEQHHA